MHRVTKSEEATIPYTVHLTKLLNQVDKDTTKLAYMRAAMNSLASVHGLTFSFMKSLGGRQNLLQQFPTIKEQVLY